MTKRRRPETGFDDAGANFRPDTAHPTTPQPTDQGAMPDGQPPTKPGADEKKPPHYHGHRDRLRARFLAGGSTALQDYELMELVLFRAIPRRDVKPLAKALIDRFGSFANAISAEVPRLMETRGVGEAVATEIKIVQATAIKLAYGQMAAKPIVNSGEALLNYCTAAMAYETREQFRILFLDTKHQLIADEVQNEGTINHTAVYPREVAKRALELGAVSIILVHNHPSGDPNPSSADIMMTRRIVDAAKAIGVKVFDHLIIGRGRHTSLKADGML